LSIVSSNAELKSQIEYRKSKIPSLRYPLSAIRRGGPAMNFLAPWTALIAAAVSVPLLVLLYFLKLRRREVVISSTLLWRRAVQDLQVNAPFQRLRRNLLLLLQLLALAAMLAALARPVLRLSMGPGKRYVLLIDRSASMSATDVSPTRLDQAKRQASLIAASLRASSLGLGEGGDQAMVVAFDEQARVMCNFTSDRRQVQAAIDAIQPTDGRSRLGEALTVARAFARSTGAGEDAESASSAAVQIELFSDGRIADTEELDLPGGAIAFHRIGLGDDNLAVVALQARRSFEKSDQVEIFAMVANFGPEARITDLQLSLDGAIRSVRRLEVPAFRTPQGRSGGGPGLASLTFALSQPSQAVVEVRQTRADLLAADDAAWAVLPGPRRLAVLLVTAGQPPLRSALRACPFQKLDVLTPAQFDALDPDDLAAQGLYDVIVLDNYTPARLPRGRFLVFGRPPAASGVAFDQELRDQVVVDWRSRHPVLQHVNLDNLYAQRAWRLKLPAEASVLAEFASAPALALVRHGGSVFLLAPFDSLQTNWPFEPSFVLFCYNATAWLGLESGPQAETALRVGQPISLDQLPPGQEVVIADPDGHDHRLRASSAGTLHFPATARAGLYTVRIEQRPPRRIAVNLLDPPESRIAPADNLRLLGREIGDSGEPQPTNMELWPLLAFLGLLLACLEWVVYNRRAQL